jgi:predicted nucleic acid-binding protein
MILADTSVWISHLRGSSAALAEALTSGIVVTHPFVIGELACGHLRNRGQILGLLRNLPRAPVASDDEVLSFIDTRKLMGLGLGYVDMHLLAAVALAPGLRVWSEDKQLAAAAERMGVGYRAR